MTSSPTIMLSVSLSEDKVIQCELEFEDLRLKAMGITWEDAKCKSIRKDFEWLLTSSRFQDSRLLIDLAQRFARIVVPEEVADCLRQISSSRSHVTSLCVYSEDGELQRLPWEFLPIAWPTTNLQVVRLARRDARPPKSTGDRPGLLAFGWPDLPGASLPGIARELTQLPQLLHGNQLSINIHLGPARDQFCQLYEQHAPTFLHLAMAGIDERDDETYLPIAADSERKASAAASPAPVIAGFSEGIELLPLSVLCDVLSKNDRLEVLVLNTCHGGLAVAESVSRRCQATAIGWAGFVSDNVAADFALYFYQRLLEGRSPAESLYSYLRNTHTEDMMVQACVPVVWLPGIDFLNHRYFAAADSPGTTEKSQSTSTRGGSGFDPAASFTVEPDLPSTGGAIAEPHPTSRTDSGEIRRPRGTSPEPLEVKIELEPAPTISPSMLKNEHPVISRLGVFCSEPTDRLRVEVVCDAGIGTSQFRRMQSFKRGHQTISEPIHFPILHELCDRRVGRRRVNFLVTVSDQHGVLAAETRSTLWMGFNEWMDREDTWSFIPSFVFANSEAVREVFDKAVVELRKIGSPHDSFSGYQRNERGKFDPRKIDLQMRAIFQTLRDTPLDYINPPGAPIYLSQEERQMPVGQVVRFPSEILQNRRGTCHDLALLVASCAEHVGIYPLIILCARHTFCAYWRDHREQYKFWKDRRVAQSNRASDFGSDWLIRDPEVFVDLLESRRIIAIESTCVTQRKSFSDACSVHDSQKAIQAVQFQAAVDVWESRRNIQPL